MRAYDGGARAADVLASDDAGIPGSCLADGVGECESLVDGKGHDHGRFELRHGSKSRSD